MSKAIWKYSLEIVDRQTVKMPQNAEILSVDNQRGHLCLWAFGGLGCNRRDATY